MAAKSSPKSQDAAEPVEPSPVDAAEPVAAAAVDVVAPAAPWRGWRAASAALAAAGIPTGDVISFRLDAAAGRLIVVTRAGQKLSLPVGGGAG